MTKRIPTKLTGPITSTIVNKRRVKVFPTDVGDMTAKEISEATGIKTWKILQRYYAFGWQLRGIFSDEKLVHEKEEQVVEEFSQEMIDFCRSLTERSRFRNLQKIKIGTWEAKQCAR